MKKLRNSSFLFPRILVMLQLQLNHNLNHDDNSDENTIQITQSHIRTNFTSDRCYVQNKKTHGMDDWAHVFAYKLYEQQAPAVS